MSEVEKNIDISGPSSASEAFATYGTQGSTRLDTVTNSIPDFTKVEYSTYKAEHSFTGNDIVIHFYLPTKQKVTEAYWKLHFAAALNDVGQEHFQATAPRLVAKYTDELNSWWFKAQGYDHIIDLPKYLSRFFEALEERMAPVLQTQSRTS
jgi:hypothetical protein